MTTPLQASGRDEGVSNQDYSLTAEQERDFVERARQGDSQARENLILSCHSYLKRWALRLVSAYRWACSRLDYEDVMQEGYEIACKLLDKALEAHNPIGFLHAVCKYEMRHYCYRHASLVILPDYATKEQPTRIESLDTPLCHDADVTYAEMLEAPTDTPEPHKEYTGLYEALDLLNPQQRDLVMRYHGLGDYGAHETLKDIGRHRSDGASVDVSTVCESHTTALKMLRTLLGTPDGGPEVYSAQQARSILGVSISMLSYLTLRAGIERIYVRYYRKADIHRLAQQRAHQQPNTRGLPHQKQQAVACS